MMRSNPLDAARRAFGVVVRGLFNAADDSKLMQTVDARLFHNEQNPAIERFQQFGFSVVPQPPDSSGKGAEALVMFLGGNRSHPIVVAVEDRRYRVKNLKPGESSHFDDQGQYSKVGRDGHHRVAKKHTFTANDNPQPGGLTQPATTFELNEQLKGLSARVAQAEHNLHGLFDVTSQFRAIVQGAIPEVSAVAGILNQDPTGLKPMADAIAGKEQAYLQQQVTQALQKFLSPNLGSLSSLLAGGLEQSITDLQSQIASLVSQNPVVSTVDNLTQELANLTSSSASASAIAAGTADLQGQISALTAANPIVGTIAGLRNTLSGLIGQAGPGLNFLAPQQRLTQGKSQALTLTV